MPGLVAALMALTQTEAAGSAALTGVTGSVQATQVSAAADLRGQTYAALGDSISAGYDAPAFDQIFPAIIARDLGMNLALVARSGTRAAWGVGQVSDVLAAHPRLVTIELGTNDVGFTTPPDAFAQQYEAILAGVSGPSTRVVCIDSWLPSPPFQAIMHDVCQRYGGTFVSLDGFYAVNAFHAKDGGPSVRGPRRADWFHPSAAGHAAIARAVLAALGLGTAPDLTVEPSGPELPAGLHARLE
jgi:lysophospholipase L1-like esterase